MMAKESCSMARPASVSCSVTVLARVSMVMASPGLGMSVAVLMGAAGVAAVGLAMVVAAGVSSGMAVVVQMFLLGRSAVLAAVAFEHAALGQLAAFGLGIKQRENDRVEAEVRAQR